MNYRGKLYTEKVRGKHVLLSQTATDVDDLVKALNECIYALEYAAFNLDGTKEADVPINIFESTSPSHTAILAARKAKEIIRKF